MVQVAELVPAVVRWNREELGGLAGHLLDDPRVTVVEQDVSRLIDAGQESYHAIVLDVDNGPAGLTRRENRWIYSPAGLAAARRALKPRGLWAVWSAGNDEAFTRRLGRAGFEVEQVTVPARRGGKGARHMLWIGRRE